MLIQAVNLTKKYKNGVTALRNVNLAVDRGEFVFLTGQSGAGKSTLIRLLFREELPTGGAIFIDDRSISKLSAHERVVLRRNTGVVFQDFRLLEKETVFENIAFAMKAVERPMKEINMLVPKVIARVGLAGRERDCVSQLSGGEQQRVAVARAIINDPFILFADEPTGDLDPETSADLMKLFEEINAGGTTIIMATHDKNIVNAMHKRVITMRKGEITSDSKGGWAL